MNQDGKEEKNEKNQRLSGNIPLHDTGNAFDFLGVYLDLLPAGNAVATAKITAYYVSRMEGRCIKISLPM